MRNPLCALNMFYYTFGSFVSWSYYKIMTVESESLCLSVNALCKKTFKKNFKICYHLGKQKSCFPRDLAKLVSWVAPGYLPNEYDIQYQCTYVVIISIWLIMISIYYEKMFFYSLSLTEP